MSRLDGGGARVSLPDAFLECLVVGISPFSLLDTLHGHRCQRGQLLFRTEVGNNRKCLGCLQFVHKWGSRVAACAISASASVALLRPLSLEGFALVLASTWALLCCPAALLRCRRKSSAEALQHRVAACCQLSVRARTSASQWWPQHCAGMRPPP